MAESAQLFLPNPNANVAPDIIEENALDKIKERYEFAKKVQSTSLKERTATAEEQDLVLSASSKKTEMERLAKAQTRFEEYHKIKSKLIDKQFKVEQDYQHQIDATDDENVKRSLARERDKSLRQIKFDQIRAEASERYESTEQRIGDFLDDVTNPAKFLKRKTKEASIATIAWLLSKKRRKLDQEETLKNIEERGELSTEQSAVAGSTALVPSTTGTALAPSNKKSEDRLQKMFKGFMPPANYYENMLLSVGSTKKHQEMMSDVTGELSTTSTDALKSDKKRNKFQKMMSMLQLPQILAISAGILAVGATIKLLYDGFLDFFGGSKEKAVAATGATVAGGAAAAMAGKKLIKKKLAGEVAETGAKKAAGKLGTKVALKGAGKLAARAVPVLGTALMAGEAISYGANKLMSDEGGGTAALNLNRMNTDEKEVVDLNLLGKSVIKDWPTVEGLPIKQIEGLINYNDWDDSTMSKFEQIIAKKQGKVEDLDPKALPSSGKADQLEQAALTTPNAGKETGTSTSQNSVVNAPVTNVTNQTIQDKSFNNDITVQQMNPWAIKEQYA